MDTSSCKNYERVPEIANQVQKMDRELGVVDISTKSNITRIDKITEDIKTLQKTIEDNSDLILGHIKKEEGMYKILVWLLAVITGSTISFITWSYNTSTDIQILLGKQEVLIESNNKLVNDIIKNKK